MEGHVLSTINWVLGHPTTESWLRLACTTGQIQEQRTQHIARFLMEITLFHKEYIAYKPSELAIASLLLARFILGKTRRVCRNSLSILQRRVQLLTLFHFFLLLFVGHGRERSCITNCCYVRFTFS